MRLRVLTTALFLFGLALLVGWPWIMGDQPVGDASQRVRAAYALRLGIYFLATILVFFIAALSAYFLVRSERRALRNEAKENVKELIEGTLQDHEQKKSG